jgi:hypothetical protein
VAGVVVFNLVVVAALVALEQVRDLVLLLVLITAIIRLVLAVQVALLEPPTPRLRSEWILYSTLLLLPVVVMGLV